MARKSREEAAQTLDAIKSCAFDLGSAEGMEALSIARIADHLGLSKSGVAGHFENKTELQLAAVEQAATAFTEGVVLANNWREPGVDRLRGYMYGWLRYVEKRHEVGGCFLTAASFEYDDRPGEVRDAVAEVWRRWMRVISEEARTAGLNGARTAFKLHSIVTEAMWMHQLFDDPRGWQIARETVDEVLARAR
ncbi:MAG: TetR/AcrR family transcriptional regulator [Solirubrobacterales bacterium]